MKKNLFFLLGIAALVGLSSCSSDETAGTVDTPQLKGEPAYASFSIATETKATVDFDSTPLAQVDDEADDMRLVATDVWLFIFDVATGTLEKKQAFGSATTATVLVTAGSKKIFVTANTNALADITATGAVSTTTYISKYGAWTEGTTTLTAFLGEAYDAGTPQYYDVVKASSSRTFKLGPLTTQTTASQGLPVGNSNELTYTIVPDITDTQSQAGTGSATGASANNHFAISLKFMSAKARIALLTGSLIDGTAPYQTGTVLTSTGNEPKWTLKNQPKLTNYIEGFSAKATSYYYNFDGTTTLSDYTSRFDAANNIDVLIPTTYATDALFHASNEKFLFTPDNNNYKGNSIQRGQSTFYAIQLKYVPRKLINTITGHPTQALQFRVDSLIVPSGTTPSYTYLLASVGSSDYLQPGVFFADSLTLAKAIWMELHYDPSTNPWTGSSLQLAEAQTDLDNKIATVGLGARDAIYYQFKNSTSYYRLDIGSKTGSAVTYGINRGNKYEATVSRVNGPGFPDEKYLFIDPEKPVVSNAYLTADITVLPWNPVPQYGETLK
ncbi:MAG: hypothetical protein LBR06_01760 [Bacteroidales bacterium]|jgi:hypothetical protein|nr:hypothetical protein [Bacteroidales bacterium]